MNGRRGLTAHVVQLTIWGCFLAVSVSDASCQFSTADIPHATDSSRPIGSTYVPIDSWVYPALVRLQALGYLDTAFLGLRPWTRSAILSMLDLSEDNISAEGPDTEALRIYVAVDKELRPKDGYDPTIRHPSTTFESAYIRALGIAGTPLRDSFHLGQTIVNDYGRPLEEGFNL